MSRQQPMPMPMPSQMPQQPMQMPGQMTPQQMGQPMMNMMPASQQQQQQYPPRDSDSHASFPSLYVGNLPKEGFYDLDFYKVFTAKGYKMKAAKVVLDKAYKLKGYGYLTFFNQNEADKCQKEMNNMQI
jgi:RNA recognition motif-containing protein